MSDKTSLSDLARKAGFSIYGDEDALTQYIERLLALHVAELCAGVEPVAYLVKNRITSQQRLMFGDGPLLSETAEPLYPATTVAALQARVAELEAKVAMIADIAHAGGLVLGEDLFAAMNMVRKLTIRDVHPSHTEGELRARVQVAIDEALRSKK